VSTAPWAAESLHLLPGVGAARFTHKGEPLAPTPGRLGATDSGKGPHYSSTPPAGKSTRAARSFSPQLTLKLLHHSLKLSSVLLQSAEAGVGRGVLAEQTRVVGRRFLLGLNLRDLPLHHRQLSTDTSQLMFQGAAVGFSR